MLFRSGDTALMFTSLVGDLPSAKLRVAAGANVNDKDGWGVSATAMAAHSKYEDLVEFFLENGANASAEEAGFSALHPAIMHRSSRMVKALLDHGAEIDAREANPEATLAEIREQFGRECLPLNLPAAGGSRVVDCFFNPSGDSDFSSVEAAHAALVDQVVEVDEKLMELYLEKGEVSPEELHAPFEKALREGHLVPVC